MRIERIELNNFGSYEESNVFDISSASDDKRIVIIGGKNGAGKTTLFTAIQTCLYGHTAFGFKSAGKRYLKEIYQLINNNARLDEAKSAYVRILFTEQGIDSDLYEVTRFWQWNNGIITETFTVSHNGKNFDEEEKTNFQNYLLHLIPPELLKLYFFDGEKIAEYFLDEQHNNIKDALLVLSGNDTFEILYNNIRRLLNGTESGNESVAQDYADQKEALARYRQEEQRLAAALNENASDIEHLEAELLKENEAYASNGGISLDEWKNLQRQIKEEEEKRERLNWELKSAAADILPFLIVKDLLADIRDQIQTENALRAYRVLKKSLSASQFKRHLTLTVKKTSSQDPSGDSKIIADAILSFFEDRNLESKEEIFKLSDEEANAILTLIASIEQYKASTFARYRRRINDSIQRSKDLRDQLQKSSIENFQDHIQHVAEINAMLGRANLEKEKLHTEIESLQEKIAAVTKALEATRKLLEAELKKQSVSALSDRMLLLVEELQEQQYRKLLACVEADLNKKFRQLIRKDDFVDHIYIDTNFALHLIRRQNVEVPALQLTAKKHGAAALKASLSQVAYQALLSQLATTEENLSFALADCREVSLMLPMELDYSRFSNGEKQVLVMSLYWAIMNQSHSELPFIIDTPFARIDSEHRANITEKFFKELQGQLFVLSTNEELRHEHITALDQQISKVYMLEYGDDKRTRISEGSYFEV